jgi:single-strand DNA-binding protein
MIIVEIAGFLGADPEERFTANGKRVITLRVATRVRQGGQDETVWWRVNIWGDRFDKMLPYLKKGSAVIIVGEMSKPETYTARDGSVQVSLTLSAEMIKFSPFGRPDKSSDSHGQPEGEENFSAKGSFNTTSPYAGVGASLDASPYHEESFAADNLPF